jgi:hypothetical protein
MHKKFQHDNLLFHSITISYFIDIGPVRETLLHCTALIDYTEASL